MIRPLSWRRSNESHVFFSLILLLTPTFLNAMIQKDEIDQEKFLGYYHEELEEMYTRAPEKMKVMLKKVRDPLYNKTPQTRAAFFIGEPGTDKTTGAIKNHVFYEEHVLDSGIMRFPADGDMAMAWKRLQDNNILACDIMLLKHELAESILIKETGNAREAHNITDKLYNWVQSYK